MNTFLCPRHYFGRLARIPRSPLLLAVGLCLCGLFPVSRSVAGQPSPRLGPGPKRVIRATDLPSASDFTPPRVVAGAALAPVTTGGTWTPLANKPSSPVQLMLLLTDGTVMAAVPNASSWYRLTPDTNGNYVNGTWTTLASMADTRLFYCSYVLRDGRVFVAGSEYGSGGATSEVYDPLANKWTRVPVPTTLIDPTQPSPFNPAIYKQAFSDNGGMMLPDGTVMVAPVLYKTAGQTMIFNPSNNTWSAGASYLSGTQDEATWVKLRDDSILTVDNTTDPNSNNSERYIPLLNAWVKDGVIPISLYGSVGGEIGAAFLLPPDSNHPSERAFFLGGNGNTAFYTPSGSTNAGTWQAGPVIPNVLQYKLDNDGLEIQSSPFVTPGAAPDSSAAMMVNGKILCAFSGQLYNDPRTNTSPPGATKPYWNTKKNPQYAAPTSFFEYDPSTNAFTRVNGPTGPTDDIAAYQSMMLQLPDGTVLYANQTTNLFVYRPDGAALPAGKPALSGISQNADGSYHLTGTLLNGISQGAAYGDDAQMDSNYPLVRLTDSSGNVFYARTYNWSSTSVMTGTTPVTTDFTVPAGLSRGTYALVVIANGISSDSIPLFVQEGANAHGRNEKVVLKGDNLLSGGIFESANIPDINNSGQVAFQGQTADGIYGIFLGTTTGVKAIVQMFQKLPDDPTSYYGSPGYPVLDNSGVVVFPDSTFHTVGVLGDVPGIFSSSGGDVSLLVQQGDSAPSGGTFISLNLMLFNGSLAFMAATSTSDGGVGLYGVGKSLALPGDAAPGGGTFTKNTFEFPAINSHGEVSFYAQTAGGPGSGIYLYSGGTRSIVLQGASAPDGGAFSFLFNAPQLNDLGQVAFSAQTTFTADGDFGVFLGTTSGCATIALPNDPAPGGGAYSGISQSIKLNNQGQVAFFAGTRGGPGLGIYRGATAGVERIAWEHQPAPGGGSFRFDSRAPLLQLNNSGHVAFIAETAYGGGPFGIFLGDGVDVVKVISIGDSLAGGIVTYLNLGNNLYGTSQLNDSGQIAYNVQLDDNRHGIFLFTPTLVWRTTASGSWDAQTSWTLGLKPSAPQDVVIGPASSVTVTGPAADTAIHSLQIGGGAGQTTLSLRSGVTITTTAGITILAHGVLTAHATGAAKGISAAGIGALSLGATVVGQLTVNSGGVVDISGGTLTVNGEITNDGTFILSSGATLAGVTGFINNGVLDITTAGPFTPPVGFVNNGVVLDKSAVKVKAITKTEAIVNGTEKIIAAVNLTIDSYTGHTYQLQVSSSLAAGSFANLGDPQQGSTGAVLTFSDPNATGPLGFYRIIVDP